MSTYYPCIRVWLLSWGLLTGLTGCGSTVQQTGLQTGYVQNQTLFEAYQGTQEAQAKLQQMQQTHQYWLDSMYVHGTGDSTSKQQDYQRWAHHYQIQEQTYWETASTQLWHQINTHVKAYGQEKGYDYIFGAVGNGSLMYAPDSKDITTQVSHYINQRYAGE